MTASTLAPGFKDAVYERCLLLWAGSDVQVSFGHPGQHQADDLVAVMDVRSEQDAITFGTQRSREETLTLTVMFSVFRAGGPDRERVASDRAFEVVVELAEFARVTDTTFGGVVRECFLQSVDAEGSVEPSVIAAGRLVEVLAVFVAKGRVRS
jgi:hypothetical protein